MEVKYPTYDKPHQKAEMHMRKMYPCWHWWDGENHEMLVHRWVWEQTYGKIPDGCVVHHKNGDPGDYRIENLELMTKKQHQILHLGTKVVDGKMMCSTCGETKPIEEFVVSNGKRRSTCKECKNSGSRSKWATNHEDLLGKAKKYRENNKGKVLEWKKQYREKNPEKTKATLAAWYEKNKEEYNRKRREAWAIRKSGQVMSDVVEQLPNP